MQMRSFAWSMLFGSFLLVGCAEPPATAPATEEESTTTVETDDAGTTVMEEDVEATE